MPRATLPRARDDDGPRPDVIVDFTAERGLLFVRLQNIGARSAYRVTTRFAPSFRGLGGEKCISALRLFRCVEFVPPGKAFVQLVDPVAAYFKRREPARLTATIAYRDREGRRYQETITHDLRIFTDLGFVSAMGGAPTHADRPPH